MSDEIHSEVFSRNNGATGETFGPMYCYSCDEVSDYGVNVVGDTELGDLLNLGEIKIEVEENHYEMVPETVTVCEGCFDDLLAAKRLQGDKE